MTPFIKLAHPDQYVACRWDLASDPSARNYWIDFFRKQMHTSMTQGIESAVAHGESHASASKRAEQFRKAFNARLDDFHTSPGKFGRVTILTFDIWRDQLLRQTGFLDPFALWKHRENEKMLKLLPAVCRQLDALHGPDQVHAVIKGVFAGNIFDMGVAATAQAHRENGLDFFHVRDRLAPRPWLIDDFDQLINRLLLPPHHKAVIFIDNAGSDFLLGVLPFARWLARRGAHIVLAANEQPTLNDMSIHDLRYWWPHILQVEPSLNSLPFSFASTGTSEPLIDLSNVSIELNHASADADLVVLEGMGRGVESNTDVRMTCDSLNIAMVKDAWTALQLGGKPFDLVCRFRQPDPH